ncbi:MAG: transcription antitermination factor NusB [Candidatus Thorarchaeota archaeon]
MNSSDDSTNALARKESLNILVNFEKSHQSLRSFLREYLDQSALPRDVIGRIQSLALGVIRYRNTIDFILHRCSPYKILDRLSRIETNQLRLAIFEGRWFKTPIQFLRPLFVKKTSLGLLEKGIVFDLHARTASMNKSNKYSILYSHPTFLVDTLIDKLGDSETISLLKANNAPDFSYVRVNKFHQNPDVVISALKEAGVLLKQDIDIPFLFLVQDGLRTLIDSPSFRSGDIFIQDKASVLTVTTLNPMPGDIVWDACAAPGMKTHLIWELMNGKGKLVASDASYQRLRNAQQRFKDYNLSEIEWTHIDSSKTSILGAKKILIDAPCTSTGMLRSHPSFKWRLNKNWLFSIMTIQNKILDGILSRYSDSPGTEIVYSTCSFLPHEGENQIDSVLERFNVELLDGSKIGQNGYSDFKCSDKVRRLFPHLHGTDGFFVAHLRVSD